MTLTKKIKQALDKFDIKTRDNGDTFVCFKSSVDSNDPLWRSVYRAHGGKLPNDWIFNKYYDVLDTLGQYNIATEGMDAIHDNFTEIVDGLVDVYTHDLTGWLHSHNENVYYLGEAMSEYEPEDGLALLSMAQYKAIEEIAQEVINYLENNHG